LKDFASNDNSVNDGTEAFFREDNIGSSTGGISCAGDGNSNVGTLEGRGICRTKSEEKEKCETSIHQGRFSIRHKSPDLPFTPSPVMATV
jgi:hypothetical protein